MTIEQIGQYLKENVEGLTKKQGEEAYKALVEFVKAEANKEINTTVALPKLGRLTIKFKDEYEGKNPRTGESMMVAPMRKVTFAAYDSFKAELNSLVRE